MDSYLYKQARNNGAEQFSANATDGILRNTLALAGTASKPTLLDNLRLKRNQGIELAAGNNGISSIDVKKSIMDDNGRPVDPVYTHSNASRARQLGAVGLGGVGLAGGALAGALLAKALNKKMKLDGDEYAIDEYGRLKKKKKKLLKRLGAYGLLGAGIIGGGMLGSNLGLTAAGFMNGLGNNTRDVLATRGAAALTNPDQHRMFIKDQMREGNSRADAERNYRDAIRTYTPINRW